MEVRVRTRIGVSGKIVFGKARSVSLELFVATARFLGESLELRLSANF